jgi:hypothetical protein
MTQTEAQKRAKQKWVENNKELNNALHNEYTKKYYQNNREARLEYARQYREKQKELKSNVNI